MRLGKMPHYWIRKRCRYYSLEKFEDNFDTALHFRPKNFQAVQVKWQSVGNPAIGGHSFLLLDEAVIVIISGLERQAETLLEPAK